jgi:hypothetical protein
LMCDHCADVIGAYEPMVFVIDGHARPTSKAAEPAVGSEPGDRYHESCYLQRFDAATP